MPIRLRDIVPTPELDRELGLLLAMFEDGTNEWRRELTELDLPQEAITWKPHGNFQSIGNILTHMAAAEARWIHELAQLDEISEEELMKLFSESIDYNSQNFAAAPDEPLEWYLAKCDEVRQRSIECVHKLGDPQHTSIRVEKDYGYTLRWILHHVITHEAYHGGQAVLLGMMYQTR